MGVGGGETSVAPRYTQNIQVFIVMIFPYMWGLEHILQNIVCVFYVLDVYKCLKQCNVFFLFSPNSPLAHQSDPSKRRTKIWITHAYTPWIVTPL